MELYDERSDKIKGYYYKMPNDLKFCKFINAKNKRELHFIPEVIYWGQLINKHFIML